MKLLITFIVLLSTTSSVFGGGCNDKFPSFIVDGKNKWDDMSAVQVFEQSKKQAIPKAKKINAEGIWLADLVRPYASSGNVIVSSCGKRTESLKIEDLLSTDKSKSSYYLAKTKKKTFKLVFADGDKVAKPALKRIRDVTILSTDSEKNQVIEQIPQ